MEVSNAYRVDRGSDQLFLASAIRCELGPRPVLSRTARQCPALYLLVYLIVVPAIVYFPTHRFLALARTAVVCEKS